MDAAVGEFQSADVEVKDDDHIDDVIDLDESPRKNDYISNVNQDTSHNGYGKDTENLIKHYHLSSSRKRGENGTSSEYKNETTEEGNIL
ncbi:hypothetical protein GJ496_007196 [Pomphorhynchus laevis]|nr:hypothetical protein GJ496_007196 [Pomphorhynchus laevis]